MLKDFFESLTIQHAEYLRFCLKHLLKEDVALFNKYVKIKGFWNIKFNSISHQFSFFL